MKKITVILFLLLKVLFAHSQSFMDEPLFYQYMGKTYNEMRHHVYFPYFNYSYSRIPRGNVLSGGVISSGYMNSENFLNGKGRASVYTHGTYGKSKTVYSLAGNDGSLLNGGYLNFYIGKKNEHHLSIDATHRYFQIKKDRDNDGYLDQPLKNDLNLNVKYTIMKETNSLEFLYNRMSEQTLAGNDTLDYWDKKPVQSLMRHENSFTCDNFSMEGIIYTDIKKRETDPNHFHNKKLLFTVSAYQLQHRTMFARHIYTSEQKNIYSGIKYVYGDFSNDIFSFFVKGEFRWADMKTEFDSVNIFIPGNAGSLVFSSSTRLNPHFTLEINNRSDYLFEREQLLMNPSLKLDFRKSSERVNAYVYSQILHRSVNPVAEYFNYISSDKTIYVSQSPETDEWLRTGTGLQYNINWRLFFKLGYFYDYYSSRNVAGIYDQPGIVNFYSVDNSADHTIESEFSVKLIGDRLRIKSMYRWYLPKAEINGTMQILPWYSKHSALAVINWQNPYAGEGTQPEASLSFFYNSPVVTGITSEKSIEYSKSSVSINARATLPVGYVMEKLQWYGALGFTKRFILTAGCDNITGYKQHNLYTFSDGNGQSNAVNTWGQFYGRRWMFGLIIKLSDLRKSYW